MSERRDPVDDMIDSRREAVRGLRDAAGEPLLERGAPRWGLALSGGGIRSATFCLGLLKALADRRTLLRFDLVSTVSGGGYVGAMLGRLFSRCLNAGEAAAVLDAFAARKPPWFLWWLRSNGRYLIPSGASDTIFAFALYARNTLAIHIELGLVGLLLGAAIVLFDLAAWVARAGLAAQSTVEDILAWAAPQQEASSFVPVIAFVLPLLLWVAAVFVCAYWGARMVQQRRLLSVLSWAVWAVALAVVTAVAMMLVGTEQPAAWLGRVVADPGTATWLSALGAKSRAEFGMRAAFVAFGVVTASAWLLGLPLAAGTLAVLRARRGTGEPAVERLARARHLLTRGLANVVRASAVVVAVAALDRLAWAMAFELDNLLGAGVLLVVVAVIARAGAPLAAMLKPGALGTGALLRLANFVGLAVSFLLLAWWVSLVQRAALGAVFGGKEVDLAAGFAFAAVIAVPALAYVLLTRANMDFLNVSSLQTFYRSRLVRAYLGAVNPSRYPEAVHRLRPGLEPANELPAEPPGGYAVRQVSDVDPDDDVAMHDYRGHASGAPVHLITACINQTEDPRGRFNRDRRGVPLTVAPEGHFRVDRQPWRRVDRERSLTLGNWISISGGAFSPGLGANTRAGVAALATFAGVRLGYWWDGLGGVRNARRRWFPKLAALFDEARGRFPGTGATHAFLSDGGHAENTGVWPLLAQRCDLVVLADCGADPTYRFEDLENLIRRARIDLQTKIRFLIPKSTPVEGPFARFGTLDDLAAPNGTACIAIARIEYPDRARPAHLMLVKPNIWPQLPPDVANYHAANPAFPQQTTLDQFFDEAQWESYYALGCALGNEALGALHHSRRAGFAATIEQLFEDDDQAASRAVARRQAVRQRELRSSVGATLLSWLTRPATPRAAPAAGDDAAKPAGARVVSRLGVQAVNASIGIGAAATILFSAYQAVDALRTSSDQKVKDERAALKEIADLWARVPPAATLPRAASAPLEAGSPAWRVEVEAPGALAAALARTSDTLCPADDAGWFKQSPLAASIFQDAYRSCKAMAPGTAPASCDWLVKTADSPSAPSCLAREQGTVTCEPRYWAYRYAESETPRCVAPRLAERRLVEAAQKASRQAQVDAAAAQAVALAASGGERAVAAQEAASAATAVAVRAASTASAVVAEAAAPPPSAEAVCQRQSPPACCGKTVYVQAYGSADRAEARGLRTALRELGASVPPIDDVVASARARNRLAPSLIASASVRYSDAAALACATSVLAAVQKATPRSDGQVQRLAASYAQRPDQVELWLPPGFMAPPGSAARKP